MRRNNPWISISDLLSSVVLILLLMFVLAAVLPQYTQEAQKREMMNRIGEALKEYQERGQVNVHLDTGIPKELIGQKSRTSESRAEIRERERLNQAAGNLEELRRERDDLQAQVDKLREDTDEKILREQNENLRVTLEQLEGDKAELKDLAEHTDSSEETRMIKDLLKKFPSDAEDFEQ